MQFGISMIYWIGFLMRHGSSDGDWKMKIALVDVDGHHFPNLALTIESEEALRLWFKVKGIEEEL